ncbi:hypothetical protein VTK73DRAFT_4057 [Phialemonium thermophilum]|uniref:ARID domain-containing protein n=1 Tax=Phialemonium thermophilum TaxID=223376 RepID=A0ABR3VCW8_9PEZI
MRPAADAAAAATLRQVPDIVQELEARKRTVGAARTIQRVWRGYRVRRDLERLSRFQAVAKGALIRMVLREETDDEQQDGCSSAQNTTSPRRQTPALQPLPEHRAPQANRDPTEKELFYRDLQAVITHTHMKVNYWPRIGRRVIELWDLWRAVRAQDAAPDMRNWEGIAEALDFDWISDPMVTRKIKSCFEANLGRFERLMDEWRQLEEAGGLDDGGGGEGGEGPAGETEAAAEDEAADKATTTGHAVSHQTVAPPSPPAASSPVVGASHFSSSPPRLRGLKRLFDPDLVSSSDPAYPESSSRKRTRYAKDAEIPSTPDDKTGIDRLARNKARRPPVRESPSHAATAAAAAAAAAPESTTGSATSRSQQLPLLPRTPREAKQKPRSAYVVENADDDDDQDPENEFRSQVGLDSQGPTPSQQLRSEDRLYSSPPSTRRPLFADRSLPRAQGGQSSIATNQNSRGGLAEDDANASRASVPSAVESVEEAHQRPRVVHRSLPPSRASGREPPTQRPLPGRKHPHRHGRGPGSPTLRRRPGPRDSHRWQQRQEQQQQQHPSCPRIHSPSTRATRRRPTWSRPSSASWPWATHRPS